MGFTVVVQLITHHNLDTTHRKHAYEVVKSIPLTYDAIITVSGDGLIHEVLNGFAHHADPTRAFATPVAPIPTGSGNGLSLNLLGIEVFKSINLTNYYLPDIRKDLMCALRPSMLSKVFL